MLTLKYICMSVKISVSYRRALSSFLKPVRIWLGGLNLLMGQPSCLLGRFLFLTTKTWQLVLLGKWLSFVELLVAPPGAKGSQETGNNKH